MNYRNNLSSGEFLFNFPISNTIIRGNCPAPLVCQESKFRTIDGSCNNLVNKEWGQATTAFQRLLFPNYADGKCLVMTVCFISSPDREEISPKKFNFLHRKRVIQRKRNFRGSCSKGIIQFISLGRKLR